MKNNDENKNDLWESWLHEFDVDDPDKAYEDWINNQRSPEELIKLFPSEQPTDVMSWGKDDFKDYYKSIKKQLGKTAAWDFLYAKILERAGEGCGGIEVSGDGELAFE